MFEIVRYTADRQSAWNDFVARSKQGTFLFDRRYMDYHADRFEDFSLMVYRKSRLYALLPGNRCGGTFYSHQGLTYGGFITDEQLTVEHLCELFVQVNGRLRQEGFMKVVYKPMPWIYHRLPADEDIYALFVRCHARLIERDVASTVVLHRQLPFTESRLSGLRKARRLGVEVSERADVGEFWAVLSENLQQKYGARPVHSAAEMQLLKSRFPDDIRLWVASRGDRVLGGAVLYMTPQVVHVQYISASAEGKQSGALDLLFDHLLHSETFVQPYFDFGTSAIGNTNEVNASLIFQKQGFGGRSVCYDWYEYDL